MASLPKRCLFEAARSSGDLSNIKLSYESCMELFSEQHSIKRSDIPKEIQEKIRACIQGFLYKLKERWTASSRNKNQFEKKYAE